MSRYASLHQAQEVVRHVLVDKDSLAWYTVTWQPYVIGFTQLRLYLLSEIVVDIARYVL